MLIVQTSVKNGLVPLPLFPLLTLLGHLPYDFSVTIRRKFLVLEFLGSDMAEQAYEHGRP
jgi:hypothetical protein